MCSRVKNEVKKNKKKYFHITGENYIIILNYFFSVYLRNLNERKFKQKIRTNNEFAKG